MASNVGKFFIGDRFKINPKEKDGKIPKSSIDFYLSLWYAVKRRNTS